MEQKFMLLIYYKRVAPMEQEMTAGAGNTVLLPMFTSSLIGILLEKLKYILHLFITINASNADSFSDGAFCLNKYFTRNVLV